MLFFLIRRHVLYFFIFFLLLCEKHRKHRDLSAWLHWSFCSFFFNQVRIAPKLPNTFFFVFFYFTSNRFLHVVLFHLHIMHYISLFAQNERASHTVPWINNQLPSGLKIMLDCYTNLHTKLEQRTLTWAVCLSKTLICLNVVC